MKQSINIMQAHYRRLCLYASNTQAVTKKTYQTLDQYAHQKQQHIQHLKELLNSNFKLPPMTLIRTIIPCQKLRNNKQCLASQRKISKPQPKISLRRLASAKHHATFQLKNQRSNLLQPQVEQLALQLDQRKKAKLRHQEQSREKKYQKCLNEYMKSLQQQKVLQKYTQNDYARLVQEACRQIRRRVLQQEKQQKIDSTLKSHNSAEIKKNKQMKKKKTKKQHSVDNFENVNKQKQKDQQYNFPRMRSISNKLFQKGTQHKIKSIVEGNLYKLNLDQVEKISKIRRRQRRREEKQFARKFTQKYIKGDSSYLSQN